MTDKTASESTTGFATLEGTGQHLPLPGFLGMSQRMPITVNSSEVSFQSLMG